MITRYPDTVRQLSCETTGRCYVCNGPVPCTYYRCYATRAKVQREGERWLVAAALEGALRKLARIGFDDSSIRRAHVHRHVPESPFFCDDCGEQTHDLDGTPL